MSDSLIKVIEQSNEARRNVHRDALYVLLRDYESVHGDGDLEMQPALFQARKALAMEPSR